MSVVVVRNLKGGNGGLSLIILNKKFRKHKRHYRLKNIDNLQMTRIPEDGQEI